MLVTTASATSNDALLTIRGSRNNSNSATNKLRLENFDSHSAAPNDGIGIMGSIQGHTTNTSTNTGELHFYISADGVTETLCMKMQNDGGGFMSGDLNCQDLYSGSMYSGGDIFISKAHAPSGLYEASSLTFSTSNSSNVRTAGSVASYIASGTDNA